MSVKTVIANATACEMRTREMATIIRDAAKLTPQNQAVVILAEAVELLLENAATRAGLIEVAAVERRMAEFREQAAEIEGQVLEGLRSQESSISDLDRIKAGLDVWLVQGRLDAWEQAEAEMKDILAMTSKRHGA